MLFFFQTRIVLADLYVAQKQTAKASVFIEVVILMMVGRSMHLIRITWLLLSLLNPVEAARLE